MHVLNRLLLGHAIRKTMPCSSALPLACLLLGLHAGNTLAATPTEIYARASQVVLVLEGRNAIGETLLQASATALDDAVAVTQCDLLSGAEKWVVIQGKRDYAAYPHERDEARNLCRLDVPGLRAAQPDIVPLEEVRIGQRVYAIGNALGLGLSLSEGLVSGIREVNGESLIQTTAALSPGSEGGALIDDQGRLLGLTDYRKRAGQNVNFAAPAVWLPQIVSRAGNTDAAAKLRLEAARLARVEDWKGLLDIAGDWTRLRPDSDEPWLWLGAAHDGLQAHQAAIDAFEKALVLAPDALNVTLSLARNRLRLKQFDKTLELVRPALALNQESADLWFAAGVAELALDHGKEAERAFEATVKLEPWHAAAWGLLFEIAFNRGDYRMAQQAASHLTEIDPARANYWLRLAQAHLNQGRRARAMRAIEHAVAIAPESGDVLLLHGTIQASIGLAGQAIETLKRGLAAKPANPAFGWRQLGDVYYQRLLFPEAIAAQREAVRLAPNQLSYQAELGVMLKDGGQDEAALALFQALREKAPQDPYAWRQIGFVNGQLGRYSESIVALEQSLRLAPEQAKAWHALGEIYAKAERPEDTRRVYQRLRGLNAERAEQLYQAYLRPLEVQP